MEERAIKTHTNFNASAGNRSHGRTSPLKTRGHSTDPHNESMGDYSQVIERTERMKRRWLRVIENKEKMQIDEQMTLKQKYDSILKLEKKKKKRVLT